MNALKLTLLRKGSKIRVYASDTPAQTLKQYEDKDVSFEKADALCNEIRSILNRTHRRSDIAGRLIEDLKKAGQDLFDELLPPKAKKIILSTASRTISLDIDDRLIHIPWELLYDGAHFLCRKFSMGRVVSTKQNISGSKVREVNTSLKMLIIADPRKDLTAAYQEGITVRDGLIGMEDTLKVDLISSRVDMQTVRRNIRDYDIVHYTGHAEYNTDDPAKSGWLMSDGTWTAREIREITGDTPFPFLVFSNACHSGRTGEWSINAKYEQEIYDLAGAFLHSGVTHYIGTFLEVQDTPGALFAVEFYKALAKGVTIGEAVRDAREQLVESIGEDNIIWASYMLYGSPSYKIPASQLQAETTSKSNWKTYALIISILLAALTYFSTSELSPPLVPEQPPVAVNIATPDVKLTKIFGTREVAGDTLLETVTAGSRLYTYNELRLVIKSTNNIFFYIAISDSMGKARLIFNDRGIQTGDGSDTTYTVQLAGHLLRLDEVPEAEYIHILSLESQPEETEPLLWEIEKLHDSIKAHEPAAIRDIIADLEFPVAALIEIENGKMKSILYE